jgi:thiopeptide-type bacteriocin biosynthesis protein
MESNTNLNQTQTTDVKRSFIIGDEWLYYKFYTGPKTTDVILTEMVKPITEEFQARKLIDYWFFIRYADPKLHTRVRFHIPDPGNMTAVISGIRSSVAWYLEHNLVWKVQLDTYEREVERYGINSMDLAEKIFYYDSKMTVDMLSLIEGDEGERIRWLFALRAVDNMLGDYQLNMEQKFDQVTMLRENFGREFGLSRGLKDQLEKKFRAGRAEINELMDTANDEVSEMYPLFQLLAQKSAAVQPIVKEILDLNRDNRLLVPLNELMGSYSHMMINRLFKSKQRLHELVVYDFLHRYYKSEIARQKYAAINLEKKKKKELEKAKKKEKEQKK